MRISSIVEIEWSEELGWEMKHFDVAIIGGGFAGLTLAYQLIKNDKNIKICIVDNRKFPKEEITHTVGESLNEVGGIYMSKVLDLKDYMMSTHFSKRGMRFFFEEENGYCEMGINGIPLNHSFHFARGRLENDLYGLLSPNMTFLTDYKCISVEIDSSRKVLTLLKGDGAESQISSQWLIDASGMKKILAHRLGITKKLPINHSAVWFRVDSSLDINEIYPINDGNRDLFNLDIRNKASVHLEGPGYWVWLLRLSSDSTSVGITFNEETYDFNDLNTFDKALSWLESHEKIFATYLREHEFEILDFKILRKFASQSNAMVSEAKWGLTGDAYGFIDPYYSNGFDFVGLQNTLLTRIILNERKGLPTANLIKFSNSINELLFEGMKISFYDFYDNKNNWDYIVYKYIADSFYYFGFPCVMMIGLDFNDENINSECLNIARQFLDVYRDLITYLNETYGKRNTREADSYVSLSDTVFSETNTIMQTAADKPIEAIALMKRNLRILDTVRQQIKSGARVEEVLETDVFMAVHYGTN